MSRKQEIRTGHHFIRNNVEKPEGEMEPERKEERPARHQSMCPLQGGWTFERECPKLKGEDKEDEIPH